MKQKRRDGSRLVSWDRRPKASDEAEEKEWKTPDELGLMAKGLW
jgi:hypothetical protein